jgi:hypothetical protein
VDAKVSEKHTVSIFRAKMAMLGSGGIYIKLEEEKQFPSSNPVQSLHHPSLASTYESTQRQNPE